MKKITTTLILLTSLYAYAQNVAINDNGAVGNTNAILDVDVSTNNKGVLIPRLTTAQRTGMNGSLGLTDEGLTVYDETTKSFWFWDGTQWVQINNAGSDWLITGNAGTNATNNFIGTTDNVDFVVRTNNTEIMRVTSAGNVGIGLTNPPSKLHVKGTGNLGIINESSSTIGTWQTIANTSAGGQQFGMISTGSANGEGPGKWLFHKAVAFGANAGTIMTMDYATSNVGIGLTNPAYGLELNGTFGYGNGTSGSYRSRTETRDNAGQIATQSGFFETQNPTNYPAGATSWWHLIDIRHSNNANNYAMQLSGSFFDQELYFRKTNNNGAQAWSRVLTTSNLNTTAWALLGNSGTSPATNFIGTTDAVDFVTRTGNTERMRVTSTGNVGIGTTTPYANSRLQVAGGSIMPQTGNNTSSGILFPLDPGGGGGDEASIRHYVETGENTKLVISNYNDYDDDIAFRTGLSGGSERMQINGRGTVFMNRGVFFDCNDCGGNTNGSYDLDDGTGGNYGDLSIQGRVFSANSNIHLSPPGGSKVIINSSYRAAGGGTGTTGLDIEDGGIRMRKNYAYIQRYRYCNCYGAGATAAFSIGSWDFCAVAQVGFKNNQSSTDEDDDVQCAVYPNGAGYGEQTQYDYYYTEQYNTKRTWYMYLEAFEDTNGVTCAANCMNFE